MTSRALLVAIGLVLVALSGCGGPGKADFRTSPEPTGATPSGLINGTSGKVPASSPLPWTGEFGSFLAGYQLDADGTIEGGKSAVSGLVLFDDGAILAFYGQWERDGERYGKACPQAQKAISEAYGAVGDPFVRDCTSGGVTRVQAGRIPANAMGELLAFFRAHRELAVDASDQVKPCCGAGSSTLTLFTTDDQDHVVFSNHPITDNPTRDFQDELVGLANWLVPGDVQDA